MIVDSIMNIDTYKDLSPDIYAGLKFIRDAKTTLELGVYPILKNVKAIVSEYETVECFVKGYESHKHVIDIQYPIYGLERVKWSPINEMEVNIPYDQAMDVAYFSKPLVQGLSVDIGNGIFAIMFPTDGHSPQHFIDMPSKIKKITIKVSI